MSNYLSDTDIENAMTKWYVDTERPLSLIDSAYFCEDFDCVRIAHKWLSYQKWATYPIETRSAGRWMSGAHKHRIEKWANRYITKFDVEVAAIILGKDLRFMSRRLVLPPASTLRGIRAAFSQRPSYILNLSDYSDFSEGSRYVFERDDIIKYSTHDSEQYDKKRELARKAIKDLDGDALQSTIAICRIMAKA